MLCCLYLMIPSIMAESTSNNLSQDNSSNLQHQVEELQKNAEEKYLTGDFYGSIDDLSKAISIYPDSFASHYDRGLSYAEIGSTDEAIEDFSKCIVINPLSDQAYNALGTSYYEKGFTMAAIEKFSKALEINPKNIMAYYNRGIAKQDLEKDEDAILDFKETLKLQSDHISAYLAQATSYYFLKKYTEAISNYTQALTIDPKCTDALVGRALSQYELNKVLEALSDYEQALDIDPKNSRAWNGLAFIYITTLDNNYFNILKADEAATNAVTFNKNPHYLDTLACVYAEKGDFPKAIELEKQAFKLKPNAAFLDMIELFEDKKTFRQWKQSLKEILPPMDATTTVQVTIKNPSS